MKQDQTPKIKPPIVWEWIKNELEDWVGAMYLGKRNAHDNLILNLSYPHPQDLYYDMLKLIARNIRFEVCPNPASVDIEINYENNDWNKIMKIGA